jgi:hypothetical protein
MSVHKKLSILGILIGMIGLMLIATSPVGANEAENSTATLSLELSRSSGTWTFDDGTPQQLTQTHGRQGCKLTTDGNLITLSGVSNTTAFAGLRRGAIGTKDGDDGNGEPCARVEAPNESLVLSLNNGITDLGYVASGGQLALSFKFNATAYVDLYMGEPIETNRVRTRISLPCNGSDCGPDSGLSDVGVVDIPETSDPAGYFDTMVISSTGSVSLVSAASPKDTHLHLVLPAVTISGTKFHDRDTDGTNGIASGADEFDERLSDWTIKVFADNGDGVLGLGDQLETTVVTGSGTLAAGMYEATVPPGDYIVCEELLPDVVDPEGGGIVGWQQSVAFGPTANTVCASGTDLAPGGYALSLTNDSSGNDFLNHQNVTLQCGQSATIGGTDGPKSTVELPADCASETGFTSSFDVGFNDGDAANFGATQFVTFGGDPDPFSEVVVEQTIVWASEAAKDQTGGTYGDGQPATGEILQVPMTLVRLGGTGTPIPVVICQTGEPDTDTPDCLFAQTVAVGSPQDFGFMQLTETYRFLGDPPRFR